MKLHVFLQLDTRGRGFAESFITEGDGELAGINALFAAVGEIRRILDMHEKGTTVQQITLTPINREAGQ